MVVALLLNKLKHFILLIVAIFRRALCCFRRRRRVSVDSVPLTHVGVVSNNELEEDWNWNERNELSEPKTVQDHIELYRKRKLESQIEKDVNNEENLDFFEDMAPRITKQTKVLISTDQKDNIGPSRLNLVEAAPIETGELREWEENSGWEGETLDWDAQEALRQKKKQDRERKLWEQHQKRMEKMNRSLGAKVNT